MLAFSFTISNAIFRRAEIKEKLDNGNCVKTDKILTCQKVRLSDNCFSLSKCLATLEETIIGMLVAFPMVVAPNSEPEEDPILAPYRKLEADNSDYVCGLAVFLEYRN